jgi:hypothetical protein
LLAAGGDPNDNYTIGSPALAACELFHPTGGGWSKANAMNTGRFWHAASAPSGGGVAVAGGYNWFWTTSDPGPTAERWDIATNRWQLLPALPASLTNATLTPLPGGTLLLVGASGSWRY